MSGNPYVRWFEDLGLDDVGMVGGKTASLGELYSMLSRRGISVPNGFALTAAAYRAALLQQGAWEELRKLLAGLDKRHIADLARRGAAARDIVYAATDLADLRQKVAEAYRQLEQEYGPNVAVAVRSSATAEDLPNASFAGQHDSFLNVRGARALFEACRRCFASIFTDRAISYRIDNGFDHFKVALSVAVMKMVRSDLASSGVIFTLDTESGFRDVVFVTGAYGLGENIVQGAVEPDEFYVHKPTFNAGFRAVLSRRIGAKDKKMIYARGRTTTRNVPTSRRERESLCISDDDVLSLAESAIVIENHYSNKAGHPRPMDVEWAKDGTDGKLYIIQARPETVASRRTPEALENYVLKPNAAAVLGEGRAVGEKIAAGKVRLIRKKQDLRAFKPGEVLVAPATSPDWEPVMKIAAAIVTEHGGRTCHAAIVARELGVPAVVGIEGITRKVKTGTNVTVSCAEGDIGHVYAGRLPFDVERVATAALRKPRTKIMVNLGNPELAFKTAMMPNDGVGLARMEFIINQHIGIHPMALAKPKQVKSAKDRRLIEQITRRWRKSSDFFVERLSEGVGTIAAAFFPRPVIVRLSDFKTNEYANLTAGADFEPREENPMLGFRGAARYAHPAYAAGFALECAALRRVRNDMGLTNLKVMIPFCRRVEEARNVIQTMAQQGLKQGENGLEIYVMCEIPNNVILIDRFAELFDGFSIGSNDLTQLTLGVDRDSDIVAFDFDERDPGMLEMLRLAVDGAKRNRRHIGICGEAPANYPEIARFLAGLGIDSISVNPSSILRTIGVVYEAEQNAGKTEDMSRSGQGDVLDHAALGR
ncbi:phosphoenolpyruvate synthase [Bradyrhizobium sp. WBOS7]|uniref:Phosphoenolpyruvate synthase n=1 Tax=Bradyrhizobium betae TaxID=244734 RepID=A0AAE9N6Y6_9BRAD|nr:MULTISPECIES: phosphoenolpyruvate synthase [Bradyrhizobium]MDD1574762.1 phosphoenolpyruvate synthase [Bradyrhizobium sp. WBOS1]UUO35399.1 phosphoenolpyruvate synthase [Bradyrhizobium sp. WBOS01]MDD1531427.1 phosphoenolpyruvate synthase [Bradyrhizobium sp. WBOS2]MDD1580868.1 phosphoenolpyruvate synthase [Bradyrhizobium sp. WBOS7]MDD1604371.1 phosphoenolpyruvate synthase [Bradyrhizobium sp. WBOS16]